jgi:hypothetical protein
MAILLSGDPITLRLRATVSSGRDEAARFHVKRGVGAAPGADPRRTGSAATPGLVGRTAGALALGDLAGG